MKSINQLFVLLFKFFCMSKINLKEKHFLKGIEVSWMASVQSTELRLEAVTDDSGLVTWGAARIEACMRTGPTACHCYSLNAKSIASKYPLNRGKKEGKWGGDFFFRLNMGRTGPAPSPGLFPEHQLLGLLSDIVHSFQHGLTWNFIKSMALLLNICPPLNLWHWRESSWSWGGVDTVYSEKMHITWQWQISVPLTEFIIQSVKRTSCQRGSTIEHWEESLKVSLSKVKRAVKS